MARRMKPPAASSTPETRATFRARVFAAWEAGLRVDNASDAAGDAFLALSMMNRARWNEAVEKARSAATHAEHGAAWEALFEVVGELAAMSSNDAAEAWRERR